jgi:transcriptional regulator with GAF, ATPase, and Fis domain
MTRRRRQPRPTRRPRLTPYQQRLAEADRCAILAALRDTWTETWNVTAAAKALGLPLSTLKFKMRRYHIRRPAA